MPVTTRTALVGALLTAAGVAAVGGAGGFAAAGTTPPTTVVGSSPPPASTTVTGSARPALSTPQPPPLDNEAEPQQYYGRIRIPAIEVDSPLLEGIRISTIDYGPGHWPGTAMPGQLGNAVFAGHRTSHNADFRRLDELQPGDEVIFDLDDPDSLPTATIAPDDPYRGVYVYHVTAVFRVPPEGMWIVTQDYRHEATLFACHPPGSVSERIVVQMDLFSADGQPAPNPPDPPRVTPTQTTLLG